MACLTTSQGLQIAKWPAVQLFPLHAFFFIRTILQEQRGLNLAKNLEQAKNNPGWDLE